MGIISDFFKRIKALISKKDLEFTISNAHDVLDELKVLVDQYAIFFKENKTSNSDVKYIIDNFYKTYGNKISTSKNIFEDIAKGLSSLEKNIEVVGEYIEENMTDNSIGSSLSAKKGFCIAYVNNTEFALDYIQHLLDYYVDKEVKGSNNLTKAEITLVENNIKRFATIFTDLCKPTDKFEKNFQSLTDVVIDSLNEDLYISENKTDFNIKAFMGFKYSPVFFIARLMANYEVDKYKARKDKIKYLQLRLMYLENENKNNSDPKLEKEIELIKNRIDRLESKNYEVEKDLESNEV